MTVLKRSPLRVRRTRGGKPKLKRYEQVHEWLRVRGAEGVPSWEIVPAGILNPSQYVKDLVAEGVPVWRVDETPPNPISNGQRGARFFLAEHRPANATPVRPACPRKPGHNSSQAPAAKATTVRSAASPRGRTGQGRPVVAPPSLSIFEVLEDIESGGVLHSEAPRRAA